LLVFLSRLPLPVLYVLIRVIASLWLVLIPSRRRIVAGNLAAAFPDSSAEWQRRQLLAFARNFADVLAETIKGYRISKGELNERVRITNPEMVERFARANQSIVLLGSHEANWEWILLACSERLPFDIHTVYGVLGNAGIDSFLHAVRSRFGASLHTRKDFARELIAGRNKLRAIVLTVDGKPLPDDDTHWVQFLNQDTAFRSRFETLARLWRYPVIFVARRRTARGHYEVTFELLGEPPYDVPPFQLVDRYAAALQRSITENPADWLWTQRRWTIKKPFYD